jgi:hypothetical protein
VATRPSLDPLANNPTVHDKLPTLPMWPSNWFNFFFFSRSIIFICPNVFPIEILLSWQKQTEQRQSLTWQVSYSLLTSDEHPDQM